MIRWDVGRINIELSSDDGVDRVVRREEYISSFLLKNDVTGEVSKFNFFSVIFINVTEAADKNILPNDITCSSRLRINDTIYNTFNETFYGSIAGEYSGVGAWLSIIIDYKFKYAFEK